MGYKQSQKKGITSNLDEKEERQFCRKSLVEIRKDFRKKKCSVFLSQQNKSTRSGDDI